MSSPERNIAVELEDGRTIMHTPAEYARLWHNVDAEAAHAMTKPTLRTYHRRGTEYFFLGYRHMIRTDIAAGRRRLAAQWRKASAWLDRRLSP